MLTHIDLGDEKEIEQIWFKAKEECKKVNKIQNLIISGTFPIDQLNCSWIIDNKAEAELWQQTKRPQELKFNHGEYLNKYNISAIQYLAAELKNKKDSNRACWSLIDMDTLINSADNPVPSFLTLQASISDDSKTLSITCYYRALEVGHFLPINVSEICLVATELNKEFSYNFEFISIVIHAFNAYLKENFTCLRSAKIDLFEDNQIAIKISDPTKSKEWIKEMLDNKKDHLESKIATNGLKNLIKNIRFYNADRKNDHYSPEFLKALEDVDKSVDDYNHLVSKSSYSSIAESNYKIIKEKIEIAIRKLI
jgi:thymidylate synthase